MRLTILALALGLLATFAAPAAAPGLLVLGHERSTERQLLATFEGPGAVPEPLAATVLSGCCHPAGWLLAQDADGARGYAASAAIGPTPAMLHTWRLDAPALLASVPLPSAMQVQALAWDAAAQRLLALATMEGDSAVVVLDPADGSATALTALPDDCCVFRSGVAAWDGDSDTLAFVARPRGQQSPGWSLFQVALPTGATTHAALDADVDFLWHQPGAGLHGSVQMPDHAALELSRVAIAAISADGSSTVQGNGLAGCCAGLAGVGAVADGFLYRAGLGLATGQLLLYRIALADGEGAVVGAWPQDFVPNGLLGSVAALPEGYLFGDGFEATQLRELANAAAGKAATSTITPTPGIDRGPDVGSMSAGAAGSGAHAARAGTKGTVGPAPGLAPVQIPSLGPLLLAALALLMLLAGARRVARARGTAAR